MTNILVTNYDNSGEDVMVFNTNLTEEQLKKALNLKSQAFGEVYEVPDKDTQYYCYEALYADSKFDNNVLSLINQ